MWRGSNRRGTGTCNAPGIELRTHTCQSAIGTTSNDFITVTELQFRSVDIGQVVELVARSNGERHVEVINRLSKRPRQEKRGVFEGDARRKGPGDGRRFADVKCLAREMPI